MSAALRVAFLVVFSGMTVAACVLASGVLSTAWLISLPLLLPLPVASAARLAVRATAVPASIVPAGDHDKEEATVNDIMVPRHDIAGLNLDDDWNVVRSQLHNSRHTRLPVFEGTIDNLIGVVHLREVLAAYAAAALNKENLRALAREPYFIPEATPLRRQLAAFRESRQRLGLVVDEYGDIRGLLTPQDILEEITGELAAESLEEVRGITAEADGSYLVSGSISVRTLNRVLHWSLPVDGPKTLNGLILEMLETIPSPNMSVRIAGYPMEIVQSTRNAARVVRLRPQLIAAEITAKTGEFVD